MKALKTPNLRLLVAVNALHSMKQDWTNRAGFRNAMYEIENGLYIVSYTIHQANEGDNQGAMLNAK